MMKIIARGSNRIFVGAPLCGSVDGVSSKRLLTRWTGRNEEFLDISANFATDVIKGSGVLTFVPHFLLP